MPLKLRLQSTGPGRGLLRVEGHSEPVESVNLALRRNDGRYLGEGGAWQPTPYWHPQFGAQPGPDGLGIELGPALMDAIVAMHGQPLLLTLRRDDREDSGVLRIRGALIGSNAAAEPDKTRAPVQPQGPATEPPQESESIQAPTATEAACAQSDPPPTPHRPRWPLLLGAALVLALIGAGLGAAWYLGWLAAWIAPPHASGPEEPPTQFLPSPESVLTGRAFAVELLAGSPSAKQLLAAAEARSEAGDCDAALILYDRAIDADGALGAQVARLYDPASFTAGGCIDAPNEDIALVYLRTAADAGVPAAMRRAGEILIGRASSGPVHDEGRAWLRRAEAAEREAPR